MFKKKEKFIRESVIFRDFFPTPDSQAQKSSCSDSCTAGVPNKTKTRANNALKFFTQMTTLSAS